MPKWLMYAGLVLAGVVFADQIRGLPLLSKIPSV
jgi:hypothetical protein